MKLATLKDGSRDGQLVVVSRDLASAHYATGIASRLQQVLDDWGFMSPQLQDLADALNAGRARHAFPFDPQQCMAPLPRTHLRAEGFAYAGTGQTDRPDAPASPAEPVPSGPMMALASGDRLLGPCDPVSLPGEDLGIDFGAQLAVVTGDVALGATPEQALEGIRLLLLCNEITLRELVPAELARGQGYCQSKPGAVFGPVAVTPDELGAAWDGGRARLTLQCSWNGRKVGLCDTGEEMSFHFGQLIAHLARTRALSAGGIVAGGVVSNRGTERDGRFEWPRGYNCIADKRCMEIVQSGQASTEFMRFGDTVRIEAKGRDGQSVFGAIDHELVGPG